MIIMLAPWMAPGWAEDAMSDLRLRFLMCLCHRTLWAYVFPLFFALRRSRLTPVQPNRPRPSKGWPARGGKFWHLGPRRGTFKEGMQGPSSWYLIPVTCNLIPVTCNLIPVTCHLILDTLYLYLYLIYLYLKCSSTAVWPTRGPAQMFEFLK